MFEGLTSSEKKRLVLIMLIPVVLAGGSGTRLWPLSRQKYPKQFLSLFGAETMMQQTLMRLNGVENLGDPIVICNEDHRFIVAEQLQELNIQGRIILEPVARNTAPAIALAALQAREIHADATMLVLPADHLIRNKKAFHQAIEIAKTEAQKNKIVTFGIVPSRPETGYGYIELEEMAPNCANSVKKFVEKPDAMTAKSYIEAGNYLWNSGMFVFKADEFLNALEKFEPDCYVASKNAFENKKQDIDFLRVDGDSFAKAPNISVDYAVMEKSDNVLCVPLDADWSDVGCWKSYWETSEKDNDGNISVGDGLPVLTKNTFIYSQDKLVSTLGVEDLVIVNTADAVLVVHKDKAQEVKKITNTLSDSNRPEHINHRKVSRPWGAYDSVDSGERFQVKRIVVKPGASLSLQMHHHRAEHWIVVKGTAVVQRGEEEIILSENESTYIPLGVQHRLSNPGKMPLEIIEVQSGSYLGEDDIVRFEDTYGRG